ncbi:MAG: DUF4192 domain-containing protein, partial [Propionibacteriaceae bacterium]|nr:DUF4192 domain-containing protein [Propionibacteriaceae bacterium]
MTRQKKRTQRRRASSARRGGVVAPSGGRSTTSPPRVKVSTPADLLGLVPYLLGFCPQESLVVLLIRDSAVLLTARVDIPPVEATVPLIEQFAGLAERHKASGMVLFAYSEDAASARELVEGLVAGLERHGLLDALYVAADRWWSLMCDQACCPAEGTPYDLSTHPMAAEAVFAGLTAAPGRSAVEALVSGPPADDLDRLVEVSRQVSAELVDLGLAERQELMAAAVRGALVHPQPLSDADCARFAMLAADVQVRDVAWALISRADADRHVHLWGQVVARTIAPFEPAVLCLLGMAAWISGNGALQNCCADRAARIDPTYSMTGLLEEINQRALPPSFWDAMST